jgi:branched-chain amino acid transport system ATP-binding protein
MSALLETRGLTRTFGGLLALADVSIAVEPGTVLGVIGPNGAGKSTLVNLVTGHVRPSSGKVFVDGVDLTGARPWQIAKARVARTFQLVKPFRGMTVRENVAVGSMFGPEGARSVQDALARADEVLERLGLRGRSEASAPLTRAGSSWPRRLPCARGCCSSTRSWRVFALGRSSRRSRSSAP